MGLEVVEDELINVGTLDRNNSLSRSELLLPTIARGSIGWLGAVEGFGAMVAASIEGRYSNLYIAVKTSLITGYYRTVPTIPRVM